MSANLQDILAELKAVRGLLERLAVESMICRLSVEKREECRAEISEAREKTALAAPVFSSEHEAIALEQTIARRKRLVDGWYEPSALQRMLRAISNDLNDRDRQAFDRRTTAGAADKRPRRPKPSKKRGAV